jgi:hypothetical protein
VGSGERPAAGKRPPPPPPSYVNIGELVSEELDVVLRVALK